MTIRESLNIAQVKLKPASASASLDAEVLLSFVLKKPKEYLLINPKKKLSKSAEVKFIKLLKKRTNNWPVAYLTHHKSFYGLDFYVDENVLIPRPVTEELVDMILKKINQSKKPIRILDIGTGSGCIIVSIAKNSLIRPISPTSRTPQFFASDISSPALTIAKKNARAHKVKITFKQGSLLKPWSNQHFDIIVANLPYLAKETDPSTKHEPKLALVAKNKGLALIEQLFQQLTQPPYFPYSPNLPSTLILEIGHDQNLAIKKLAVKYLPAFDIKVSNDITGQMRFAVLSLKSEAKL